MLFRSGTTDRRFRRGRRFYGERASHDISELLSTAGALFLSCCRHAATAHAEICQVENLGENELEIPSRILREAAFFTGVGLEIDPAGFLHHRRSFELGPFHTTSYLNDHSAFDAYPVAR